MGWLRIGVGVTIVAAPGALLRLSSREVTTGASRLLLRTIGIRDLALGIGTVRAARSGNREAAGTWVMAGLVSDSLDTVTSLLSIPSIGVAEGLGAAAAALSFVGGDLAVRIRESRVTAEVDAHVDHHSTGSGRVGSHDA